MLEQLIETIKSLPEDEQAELFGALEDYFLGKHIETTEGEKLLGQEEASRYLAEES